MNVSKTEKKSFLTKKINYKKIVSFIFVLSFVFVIAPTAFAADLSIDFQTGEDGTTLGSLELLFLFSLLAIAPSLLIMMTSFTRIVIVFSFLRNAIGLQQTPPNQVLIGLSLFLSLFIMQPVITEINETSIQPYMEESITQEEALDRMQDPIKEFMLKETQNADLNMFLSLSGNETNLEELTEEDLLDLGLEVIVPAFITSELSHAFTIGFLLFLPFLAIDMIVASTLMSMGMVMLPPTMISLPFKLMLFVIVDGWSLLMETLTSGFF